jgi:CPA1 family monovalent cation:H+ antiporter
MDTLQTAASLITVVCGCSYVNHRWFKMPMTIGVMTAALLLSLALIVLNVFGINLERFGDLVIGNINFSSVVLEGLLSFLLFSGSLQVNLSELKKHKGVITVLALFGTIASMLLIGFLLSLAGGWLSFNIPTIYYYLFGALISPTDPIAVLAMLKNIKGPKDLEAKIAGESLFNDGVAIVLFIVILTMITNPEQASIGQGLFLFAEEAIGGIIYGFILGWITRFLITTVSDHNLHLLLTINLVTAGYALALALGISGPLSMVVAGLLIGQYLHTESEQHAGNGSHYLHTFWELMDELLNAVLFVMIGLETLVIPFQSKAIGLGVIAIPLVLAARWIVVWGISQFYRGSSRFSIQEINVLTWGGLRGGLAVAMVLSIPPSPLRDTLVIVTYTVVTFSILVQGITFPKIMPKSLGNQS